MPCRVCSKPFLRRECEKEVVVSIFFVEDVPELLELENILL